MHRQSSDGVVHFVSLAILPCHSPNIVKHFVTFCDFGIYYFKFDEDGNGTIEFAEFLVMMATKAKEAEIEEAENFIPCCFRVMRDKKGKTLKVYFYSLSF